MTVSPKDLARALYAVARDASDAEAKDAAANVVAAAKRRGMTASLPDVLAALPAVMEEMDAVRRVTVESNAAIDAKVAAKAVAAAGIKAVPDDIVTVVVPELLGGFRIRTADRVIDASIRGKLDALAKELATPLTETNS